MAEGGNDDQTSVIVQFRVIYSTSYLRHFIKWVQRGIVSPRKCWHTRLLIQVLLK